MYSANFYASREFHPDTATECSDQSGCVIKLPFGTERNKVQNEGAAEEPNQVLSASWILSPISLSAHAIQD